MNCENHTEDNHEIFFFLIFVIFLERLVNIGPKPSIVLGFLSRSPTNNDAILLVEKLRED